MSFYSDLNYLKPQKGEILEDVDAIYQSIYSILGTKPGSRLFRPTWGGNLSKYLFEPCDELTADSMFYDIMQTLRDEPRIEIDESQTSIIPVPEDSEFQITLVFNIRGFSGTAKTLNLTFSQRK